MTEAELKARQFAAASAKEKQERERKGEKEDKSLGRWGNEEIDESVPDIIITDLEQLPSKL